MIRFACPGCGAVNTAEDTAAGATRSCASCRAAFVVPAAGPADPHAPVEIRPCPGCGAQQAVLPADLGTEVECVRCKQAYRADRRRRLEEAEPVRARRLTDDDDRPRRRPADDEEESKRIVAGVLALVLGFVGAHKFYLGYIGAGFLQILLFVVTCGFSKFLAIAEGIIYLCQSDREFVRTYQRGRKEWL
jgi:TM2 domain-containing membrane protein YozV/transcription elongation factor Elf1